MGKSEGERPSLDLTPFMAFCLGTIALVLVVTGLRAAQSLVIPVLVALFASSALGPIVFRLRDRGVPWGLAVAMVALLLLGTVALFAGLIGASLQGFTDKIPIYQEQLGQRLEALSEDLGPLGTSLEGVLQTVQPGDAMGLVAYILNGIRSLLGDAAVIVLMTLFLLFDLSSLPERVRTAMPNGDAALAYVARVTESLDRYIRVKTAVSLLTGVTAFLWVWAMGVDFPLLWGLVAFALNFIPNIGSVLAAVPPVLLALVQFDVGSATLVGLGYFVINAVYGNVVEPRMTGKTLGLSTVVVFFSLVFWGWIFGAAGMLLSVPITMMIKIALEASPTTRWIAILLSAQPEANDAGEPL